MSDPNRLLQFVENEWVRRFGRELPPPEELVPDFMRPFLKESYQVTTPAPTLQPLLPTPQPVLQSPDSDNPDEETGITTPTEEEVHQEGKSNGSQPEIGFAIQQHIKRLEEEESGLVSARQQQQIASFKDALEMPLQKTSSSATLMQLVYNHNEHYDRTVRETLRQALAARPNFTFEDLLNSPDAVHLPTLSAQEVEQMAQVFRHVKSKATAQSTLNRRHDTPFTKMMESTDDPSMRSMSVQEREGAFKRFQLIACEVAAKPTLTTTANSRHKPRFYSVLGGPGSGKSTICASWAQLDSSVMHIAIGDILRNEAKRPDSPYAEVLKANLAKGAIGDPEMTVGLIKDHIRTKIRSATGPIHTYLLDGFPRAFASAQYFERAVGPISKVIVLDIPEATLIDRCLQRNRSDDNEDAIRERIRVYNTKSAEVVDFYDRLGKLSRMPQPSEKMICARTEMMSGLIDHDFPFGLDVPKTVLQDVVACAVLIEELRHIRDECSE